jgi:hypothetical protein
MSLENLVKYSYFGSCPRSEVFEHGAQPQVLAVFVSNVQD